MRSHCVIYLLLSLVGCLEPLRAISQTFAPFALPAVSGKVVNLRDFQSKRAVVLIFVSNHCIYAQKYHDRIQNYVREYEDKGIQFVLINSNDPNQSIQDNFSHCQIHVSRKSIHLPYLLDSLNQAAKLLGVTKNPECIITIWKSGVYKILYRGMIDNDPLHVHKVREEYLKKALENVLSGAADTLPYTKPLGCDIRWRE